MGGVPRSASSQTVRDPTARESSFFEVNRAASMEADSLQDRNRGAANARWIFVSIRQGFRRYAGVLPFFFGNTLSTVTRHACKCMSSYVFIPLSGAHIIIATDLNAQILSLSGIISQFFACASGFGLSERIAWVCAL